MAINYNYMDSFIDECLELPDTHWSLTGIDEYKQHKSALAKGKMGKKQLVDDGKEKNKGYRLSCLSVGERGAGR